MHSKLLVPTVLAALALQVHGLGCYSGGNTIQEVDYNPQMTSGTCLSASGSFDAGQIKTFCVTTDNGNRVNYQIQNRLSGATSLNRDECTTSLTTEVNTCSHGSEQNHGNFFYKIDPNAGVC